MARSIHVRLDDAAEDALNAVRISSGGTDSEAVREALLEVARRRRSESALEEEVRRVANDPADRAEMRRIREEMDELAADWPE